MKPGATEHPKVYELAMALKCGRAQACGHLEMLWHFTAKFAPAGDVGRWPDQALARACDWEGDPSEFVNALHAVRFLDAHCAHRFIVHDWREHAQDAVHMALARAGKRFADDSIPKLSRLTEKEKEIARCAYSVRTTNALPSPPIPSPPLPSPSSPVAAEAFSDRTEPEPDSMWMINAVTKAIGHQPSSSQQYTIIEIQTELLKLPPPTVAGKPMAWRDVFEAACTEALQKAQNKSPVPFARYAVEMAKGVLADGIMPGKHKPAAASGKVQPGPVLTGGGYKPFVRRG